jgi:hypothetical protein
MNLKQKLSRNEMKSVLGGDLVPELCAVCIEDPYWASYRRNNPWCVPQHCLQGPITPTPPITPVPVPCPIGTVC